MRQLENVLLNAWVLSEQSDVDVEDLDLPYTPSPSSHRPPSSPQPTPESARMAPRTPKSKRETLSQHRRDERERILGALKACNWNRVRAAELSGIPRRTFYRRLRKYGIQ